MTTIEYLAIAVTTIGGLLCFIFMAFLFFGTKIPGDNGKTQIIKFKGIELQTSSIIMVLLISSIITILPLGLSYYSMFFSKTPYEVWHISGQVMLENGESLAQNDITINPPNVNVSRGGTFDLDVPIVKKQGNILKFPTLSVAHHGFTTVDIHLGDNTTTSLGRLAVQFEKDLVSKSINISPVTLHRVELYNQGR